MRVIPAENGELMEIEKSITLDLLDTNQPATSATSDMPVIETKPDSTPAAPVETEPVDASKTTSESATEHTEELPGEPDEPKKQSRGVQKKLDELVKREADALRMFEAEKQEKLRLLTLVEQSKHPAKQPDEVSKPQRPDRAAYESPEAYDAALETYIASQAEAIAREEVRKQATEQAQKAAEANIAAEQQRALEAYVQRVEKAKAKYADYTAVSESPDVNITIPMARAIVRSEHGPDIAYHLGKNPAEAARIASLEPHSQLMELGLIVAKLNAPVVAPVSAAPKPIKALTPSSEAPVSAEEESMEAYAARRQKENAARGRGVTRH